MDPFHVTAGNPSTDGLPAVFFGSALRITRQFLLDLYAYTARRPTPTGRAGAGPGSPPFLKSFTYFPRNRVTERRETQKRMGFGVVTWKLPRRVSTRNPVTAPGPWADSPPHRRPASWATSDRPTYKIASPQAWRRSPPRRPPIASGTSAWRAYKPAYTPA